jgi:tRNA pseudouridine38-40 synthase
VLVKLFGAPVRIQGAGRTDAGVHALGQVAAFDAPRRFDPAELRRALNAMLPPDILVREAAEADSGFDPRRDAAVRIYKYRILNRELRSAFQFHYAWHVPHPLNLSAMQAAARLFVGKHDFAAFRTLGTETRSTVREIYLSQWERRRELLIYRVEGSSFLRHMVRSMVSAMVEVGRNRLRVEAIGALLSGGARSQTPAPAPACGLFLMEIRYPQSPTHRRP